MEGDIIRNVYMYGKRLIKTEVPEKAISHVCMRKEMSQKTYVYEKRC